MGGCGYNAQLGAALPKKQAPVASGPPAGPPADPPAEGFRRSRRSRRRAAFGASKPVSCEATVYDVMRSLFRKPVDVACTLSTLHKVFHGVFLVVAILSIAVKVLGRVIRIVPNSDRIASIIETRSIPLILTIYIFFALSVSGKHAKDGTPSQKVSGVTEILIGSFYVLSLLVVVVNGIPVFDPVVRVAKRQLENVLMQIPIVQEMVRTTSQGLQSAV